MTTMAPASRNLSLKAHFGDSKHADALATLYWALFNGDPFESGLEPTEGVGNYGRATTSNVSSLWETFSPGDVQLTLASAVVWPAASDLWSVTTHLTHWGIYSNQTAGVLWYAGELATPVQVTQSGDQPRILPGGLVLRQDG